MADKIDPKRLNALEEKLDAKRRGPEKEPVHENHYSGAQLGWRMVTELVVGMLMGLGIGFGLDTLFGTMPWFLTIFTMLGFAAGVRTMMRTAEEVQRKNSTTGDDLPVGDADLYDDKD
jgi:ATP synthase protein I